jgi:thiol-disulfide isomerase/thioredoxin
MSAVRVAVFGAIVVLLMAAVLALSRPSGEVPPLTLYDIRSQAVALRGRVTLVNFWATTCETCVAEMPEVVALHDALAPRGLNVVAVAMPYDAPVRVVHFSQTRKLPFHVVMDVEGKIGQAFGGVEATPTTYLIGRDGEILLRILGRPDFGRLRDRIQRTLEQG